MNTQYDSIRRYRRWYAKLLRLYPKPYDDRFGEGMAQTFNDLLRESEEEGRGLFRCAVWLFSETAVGIFKERMRGKEGQMQAHRILIIIGGVILVIGSRLPWMSVPVLFGVEGPVYEAIEIGWEDNGIVTGSIGLILLFGGLFLGGRRGAKYSISGAALAALAILVVAGCVWRVSEINPHAGFFAATAVGLYVTLIGGLVALVGTLLKKPLALKA